MCVCVYILRSIALEISQVFPKNDGGLKITKVKQQGVKEGINHLWRTQTSPAEIPKSSPCKSYTTECCQSGLSHSALSQQHAPGTSLLLAPRTGGQLDPWTIWLKTRLVGGGGKKPKKAKKKTPKKCCFLAQPFSWLNILPGCINPGICAWLGRETQALGIVWSLGRAEVDQRDAGCGSCLHWRDCTL